MAGGQQGKGVNFNKLGYFGSWHTFGFVAYQKLRPLGLGDNGYSLVFSFTLDIFYLFDKKAKKLSALLMFSKTIILIPTFNERENVGPIAREIFGLYPDISVLFIDDNSPDGTAQTVLDLQKQFPSLYLLQRSGGRGFGKSYLDAFRKVLSDGNDGYENIVMMDADFSHDPKEISRMLSKLENADVVNGSRYVAGGGVENWKWHRRFLSRFANFYTKKILGAKINDMTTGFVCLKKDVLKKLDLNKVHSEGYAFLVELKYKLLQAGVKFYEHPIIYTERREGQSKMSTGVILESAVLPWKLRFEKIKEI